MMINIHLVLDEKFINSSVDMFERYYPGMNYFIVDKSFDKSLFVTARDNVFFIPYNTSRWLEKIQHILNVDFHRVNVLVHYLTKPSANRAMEIKALSAQNRLYWIFYGADLYDYIELKYNYPLFDYKTKTIKERIINGLRIVLNRLNYLDSFCAQLNYFCFWNPYDYQLLCRYVKTNASLKNFYYINNPNPTLSDLGRDCFQKKILINHSGSWTGNHLTILNKLQNIRLDDYKIILPLSYGAREHIQLIEREVERNFEGKSMIIKNFLPVLSYYKIVNECGFAIMGHRRQEAGGNTSFLLLNGKKVFLREDNSLLKYYRNLGCHLYSFEKDLDKEDAFSPLSYEQKVENRNILLNRILKKNVDNMMLNLFKD